MLAVFERVGIGLTGRIIAGAFGEASLEMVSFSNQASSGGEGVPDAEIRSSLRYLIETKTTPNSVNVEQLRRHLTRLDGRYGDERLLVVTPDPEEPGAIEALGEPRIVWIGFGLLVQAIEEVILDPQEFASEQQRFLLRELVSFFDSEGLLSADDTVIVAARVAYPEYLEISAYVCQPNRSIRDVSYLGFYTGKSVKPEIARIRGRFAAVLMTPKDADRLARSSDPVEQRLSEVIRWRLNRHPEHLGQAFDVFILSGPTDEDTLFLGAPVKHTDRGAWTQGQRYASVNRLQKAETTADL